MPRTLSHSTDMMRISDCAIPAAFLLNDSIWFLDLGILSSRRKRNYSYWCITGAILGNGTSRTLRDKTFALGARTSTGDADSRIPIVATLIGTQRFRN